MSADPEAQGMGEIDTAKPVAGDETDESVIGAPGDGMIEFDIEFAHPKQALSVVTVYATGKLEAVAAVKAKMGEKYGSPDDTQVITCEPA